MMTTTDEVPGRAREGLEGPREVAGRFPGRSGRLPGVVMSA